MRINDAPLEDLTKLDGMGSVKAQRIIQERKLRDFTDSEDLSDRIRGVGLETAESWGLDYELVNQKSEIENLRRELRHEQAAHKKFKKLSKSYEKELELIDRVVKTVKKSVDLIPPVEVPKISDPSKGKKQDETAVLLMSDVHVGKKTPTYNHTVFQERLDQLQKNMMSIVFAQRTIRPIRNLVIVMAGDIIDAESIYPGQAVDNISATIIDQVYSYAVPALTEFILFCLDNFENVTIYCQPGNHGRLNASKWSSSKSTNWDFVIYKTLEAMTREQDRVDWDINVEDWKSLFQIKGYGFLATHGDMIRMYYNLPWYGLTRQATRWQATYRDSLKLSYFLVGHFHSASMLRFNQAQIFVNGSFVTDDSYGERQLGVGSVPEQIIFGVHPDFGVSWRYIIKLN